jgi:plastocyanin
MRRRLCLWATGSALLLAGCGGDEPPPPPPGPGTVVIAMRGQAFEPAAATIDVGQTVRWVNESGGNHNAVAKEGADFKSDIFGAGGIYEWTAEAPGTVLYACTLHDPPMRATLTIR